MTSRITWLMVCIWLVGAVESVSAQATGAAGGSTAAAGQNASEAVVIATVNGKQIYKHDVDRHVTELLRGQKVDPEVLPKIQAAALKQVIGDYLLNTYLLKDKDLAPGRELNSAMNELRERARQNNTTLSAQLASQNMTEQQLMSQLAWQVMVQKYVQKVMTDEGLQKFFDEHKHLFDGTTRRVSHVLLRPDGPADEAVVNSILERAKQLRSEIEGGQIKFEEAAEKYSAGPSRQRGGDLGYVPISGVMDRAFTKTVYDLKEGEVSEPVATPFGIHLIKVTEVKEGTKTLEEVKQHVQQVYAQQLIQDLKEAEEKAAKIEYAGNYPYFKPGTTDVVMPGETPATSSP